jgi:HK97 family phage major capsid protein
MAVTAATTLSGFSGFLNRDQSGPIFERAAQMSVVQQLARRVELGIAGQPASAGTMSLKTMDPKKLAVIAVVSAEVVRANPGNYMNVIREQVAEAFAVAFDAAALHGTSSPFSTNLDTGSSTQEFTGTTPAFTAVWDDLNAGMATLVNAGKRVTGWAFDSRMEPVLNGVKDTAGRPLFIESPLTETAGPIRAGRLMGRSAFVGDGIYAATPKIYGYAGDWTQAAWGAVGGITYDISTESTVTINGALVSLWENNLVGVRAEAEYGWLVNDPASFVKFTNAA